MSAPIDLARDVEGVFPVITWTGSDYIDLTQQHVVCHYLETRSRGVAVLVFGQGAGEGEDNWYQAQHDGPVGEAAQEQLETRGNQALGDQGCPAHEDGCHDQDFPINNGVR